MPASWDTYRLMRLGMTKTEAEECPTDTAEELLAIDRIVRKAESG